jgi:hypothetical protein
MRTTTSATRAAHFVYIWTLATLALAACTTGAGRAATGPQTPEASVGRPPLPPKLLAALENQKAAMSSIYLESSSSSTGKLPNWNYAARPLTTACFDASRLYWREQLPGDTEKKREIAYDGEVVWNRSGARIKRTPIASALDTIRFRFLKWPYLDCAGVYAPSFITEVAAFSSLRPLALEYAERG